MKHLATFFSNQCLFWEQVPVRWETQSAQERRLSRVPKSQNTSQHPILGRKNERKTIRQGSRHRCHPLGVGATCLLVARRPPHSAGACLRRAPGPREKCSAWTAAFSQPPGCARPGGDPRGSTGRCGTAWGALPGNWASPRPGGDRPCRSSGLGPG